MEFSRYLTCVLVVVVVSRRQLKIEGATSLYITKLSATFFSSIIETGKEFDQVFSANRGFSSGEYLLLGCEFIYQTVLVRH